MHAGREDRGGGLVADNGTDRQSGRQGLGQGDHVRQEVTAPVLERESLARAPHAALDFVADQQRVVARGQFAGPRRECGRDLNDAALAQNGFEHDAGGVVTHGGLECGYIVGCDEPHARNDRLEWLAVLGLAGDGDRAQRAAAE